MQVRRVAAWLGLACVAAGPAAGGCQPAWAWGILLATVGLCAALTLAADAALPATGRMTAGLLRRPLAWLTWPAALLLAWLGFLTYQILAAGTGTAQTGRGLLFAGAFAVSFLLGLAWGTTGRRLRQLFTVLAIMGVALASLNVAQWLGLGPDAVLGWAIRKERPSGVYTNPNRFAVLLALCWACGVALFLAVLLGLRTTRSRRKQLKRRIALALLLPGVLLISAGLSATLSRWTLISLAMAASLAVLAGIYKGRLRREGALGYYTGHPDERKGAVIRLALLLFALVVPVAIVFALALTLAGRPLVDRLKQLDSPDGSSRAQAMHVGLDLLREKPLAGWGPGGFENAFRAVQPQALTGRWAQVHNDWLQLGIEAGIPAVALAALAALGLAVLAWRALPQGRRRARFWIFLGGGVAMAVPLLASLADFPLREPANGVLYFFLLGALARAWAHAIRPRPGAAPFALGAVLNAALALGAAGLALAALPIGLAAAASPWLWQMQPPPPRAAQAEDYRQALQTSAAEPELLYPFARCLLQAQRETPAAGRAAVGAETRGVLDRMRALDAQDYRVPWLEGELAELNGEHEKAAASFDRAVELAPAYRALRLQAAWARLTGVFTRTRPASVRANEELAKVLAHLGVLLKLEPSLDGTFAAALQDAGALPYEIAGLWPPEEGQWALSRAKYWAQLENWDLLEAELARMAGREGEPWVAALQGRVCFERGKHEAAVQHWETALKFAASQRDNAMEYWLARQVHRITPEALLVLTGKGHEAAGSVPAVALAAAARLQQQRKLAAADAMLARAAQQAVRPDIFRAWAELALLLGDTESARSRARQAVSLSDRRTEWRAWLETFERQINERSKRP